MGAVAIHTNFDPLRISQAPSPERDGPATYAHHDGGLQLLVSLPLLEQSVLKAAGRDIVYILVATARDNRSVR